MKSGRFTSIAFTFLFILIAYSAFAWGGGHNSQAGSDLETVA